MAADDIFDFWRPVAPGARVHPADRDVLDRIDGHGFDLQCLPLPFFGPLRSAPVVLLLHSPGLSDGDVAHARDSAAQAYHHRMRAGSAPLPAPGEHDAALAWTTRLLRQFDLDYDDARDKVAVLNVGAYKSKAVRKPPLFVAIPSSRVAVGWAQTVLFPQARRGERTVLCLRARGSWGLGKTERPDGGLFAPEVTQGGFLPLAMRRAATRMVHDALAR